MKCSTAPESIGRYRRQPPADVESPPPRTRRAEDSLRRLNTDRIELLYQHRVDPEVPIEDVAGTVKELIDAGKTATSACPKPVSTSSAAPAPSSPSPRGQSEYSLFWREPEAEVLPTLLELGIGLVPFSHDLTADRYPEAMQRWINR